MKKYLFALIAFSLLAGASCQEKTDVDKEEEAIKAVIKEELVLWLAQDYIPESEFVRKVDYVMTVSNFGNNHNKTIGWDSLYADLKKSAEADWSQSANNKVECKNFIIKVYDNVAWAVYDTQLTGEWKGDPYDYNHTRITFLEKVDDNWKIVLTSITLLNPCETEEHEDEGDDDE